MLTFITCFQNIKSIIITVLKHLLTFTSYFILQMQRAELIEETDFAFYVLNNTNAIYKINLKCYNNNYNRLKFLYKEMSYVNNGILLNALKF